MDLGAEVVEVKLTSIEVKSNESERSFVYRAVLADIDATHEAHVRVEKEGLTLGPVGVRRGPRALNIGDAEEAVEIGYRRRIDAGAEEDQREISPPNVVGVGRRLGGRVRGLANAEPGASRPAPTTAPAALPMNARRESACRTWREGNAN